MANESPADKVPQGLLKHVHLISAQQFPHTPAQLALDQVLDQLLHAPRIVGSGKPVSWQYISPPHDGTIFLAWQPLSHLDKQFASDGYVFPENEHVIHQPCRGYTIEIFLADSGFVMGQDPVGTHRRVRYRLLASSGGQPVDHALEIVHYTQSPRNKHVPVQSVHIDPQKQNLMKERNYLEGEGQLIRKEFMLYDKHNWPNISMPGRQAPSVSANPYQRPGMPGYPGAFPPGMPRPVPPQSMAGGPGAMRMPPVGPSPAKRQKMMPPQGPGMRMPEMGVIDDEENAHMGDVLDLLTPREISTTRYKQHHEWMEEILSSAYPVDRIIPADLHFQMSGELSELTQGLFSAEGAQTDEPRKIKEEEAQELAKRVEGYRSKGQEEMAAMKAKHRAVMEEATRRQVWVQLEQRLGKAGRGAGAETVATIVGEAEAEAGRRVGSRTEVVRVRKGGLMDREETLAAMRQRQSAAAEGEGQMQGAQDEFGEFTNLDTAGEALDFYSGDYSYAT